MSTTTRLVVLGAVHQFQPVHGYFLRRELLTWHVDEWANIQPGSIYNALRSLEKDGYIEEASTEAEGKRPERTTYRMTQAGEVEFLRLLRRALWNVETFDIKPVMALTSFMYRLRREEVLEALEHRVKEIDAKLASNNYNIEDVRRSPTTPAYVREIFELSSGRLRGEQQWAQQLHDRLLDGDYVFAGEPGGEEIGSEAGNSAEARREARVAARAE
ncbi:PadR family transcriptional regulator [Diaminobutyricimonas sp. TR449]|uniref:PadR family transcriptional regulator n=1 Tax=Diaminobutyricimonas sp. TR449 TaxID=2708076 RepID=UPI00141F49F9|nr:PadR family transcriptional regulator [Diaminobutyricimonas sp. TR449]